jgi:hypothetical protein
MKNRAKVRIRKESRYPGISWFINQSRGIGGISPLDGRYWPSHSMKVPRSIWTHHRWSGAVTGSPSGSRGDM